MGLVFIFCFSSLRWRKGETLRLLNAVFCYELIPTKAYFIFFDCVWFDRRIPADILICFICIYFPLFSVTFIQLFRGVYICFFWRIYCLFAYVAVLCDRFDATREFIIRLEVLVANQIWWLIDRGAFNGLNPLWDKICSSSLYPLNHAARRMLGELMIRFGLYPGVRCCRHMHLLSQLWNFIFSSFLFVPRSVSISALCPCLVEAG